MAEQIEIKKGQYISTATISPDGVATCNHCGEALNEITELHTHDHNCFADRGLREIGSPANTLDWRGGGSNQGYQVYECGVCGNIWGCRFQYDPGTGDDDHWHNFGLIDPSEVKRHY